MRLQPRGHVHRVAEIGYLATGIAALADHHGAGMQAGAKLRHPTELALVALGTLRDAVLDGGLPAERIAEIVFEALTSARPRVRYQITPDPMRHVVTGWLPKRVVDRIIARRLGLMPPAT